MKAKTLIPFAIIMLAICAGCRYVPDVDGNDIVKLEVCRKAAEQDDAEAQRSLGNCLFYGHLTAQNTAEAAKWYSKAAKQGDMLAQGNLAYCYFHGVGVRQNKAEAVKWLRKAAKQGYVVSQSNLGNCYLVGDGVEKNEAEAEKWLLRAAKQGAIGAQFELGKLYAFSGASPALGTDGKPMDKVEAQKWLERIAKGCMWLCKAAEQGHAEARALVDYYYALGVSLK